MKIDKNSPIPVYYQLKSMILKKIKDGEYKEGDLIPSERELCESFGISRMTARQGLNQLVQDGVLFREKGRGTFVAKSRLIQKNIDSFSETVRKMGFEPSTKILELKANVDEPKIKEILELSENDKLYHLKRLRYADGAPISIEQVYMPEKYFSGFEDNDLSASLYSLIKEKYQYIINYIDNTIQAAQPSNEERDLLQIKTITPVLRISGIRYMASGTKLFYGYDTYRSDQYDYNVRIFMNHDL